ncbi:MAG TPA: aspartate-semialdehyde dehydrogenase [Elusimicrobia bacterium]|jgi:aspartate-semialdehyde dehydrogenase|nr:aspartate-semialdehyde dehydrogenase [Elusimicrobiota bacterium]
MKEYNVAVVGATGAVGQEMVRLLELRNFPVRNLILFASARSEGRKIRFKGEDLPVQELNRSTFNVQRSTINLALFSAGATISREYAPFFAQEGIYVVDNSSAWRMEPKVPLVVPEVNPHALRPDAHLIANPNCSTIQMVVVLHPLHQYAKIKRVIVATYQSVSGAGARAMEELRIESEAYLSGRPFSNLGKKFPYPIAFNLIPQIDIFLDNLYTKEEMKMVNETQKILSEDRDLREDKNIKISVTCVRVPVFRCHSEAVWIETGKKISVGEAKEILSQAPGVKVIDEPEKQLYPLPQEANEKYFTYVGRVREDISTEKGLLLWIVADNLWKGAALNAVQIAELLVEKEFC